MNSQTQAKKLKRKNYFAFTALQTSQNTGSQQLIICDPQNTLTNNAYAIKYQTIGLDDSIWVDTRLLRNLYCCEHKFKNCCLRYESNFLKYFLSQGDGEREQEQQPASRHQADEQRGRADDAIRRSGITHSIKFSTLVILHNLLGNVRCQFSFDCP